MKSAAPTLFAIFLASPGTVLAASSEWADVTGGQARIVVAEPMPAETGINALLEVQLAPGWKTYWRDPGDAGVPLQLDVSASSNARLAEVLYPVPRRFNDGVSVWAGYDAPVTFGVKLERPDPSAPSRVEGTAFLGVCEKICVPVTLAFDIEVADTVKTTVHRELVSMRMAQMPSAPLAGMQVTKATHDGTRLTVETEVADNGVTPDLFLAAPRGTQFSAPVLKSSGGGKAIFETDIVFWKPDNTAGPAPVAYTLTSGGNAVSGSFDLAPK
jgi:DsbC/DsbD-like thiol-disulfide interchange protein